MRYTNQTAFDTVVKRLADGRGQCLVVNPSGACVYRNGHGNRCAIGALMTEEEAAWADQGRRLPQIASKLFPDVSLSMLTRLRAAHDSSHNWLGSRFIGWTFIREIGQSFNLNLSEVPA